MKTYEIFVTARGESIRCLICQRISPDPYDVEMLRCPHCGAQHHDPGAGLALTAGGAS